MREQENLVRHDALACNGNRMATNEHLHDEYWRYKRTGVPYSVLRMGIDHFKQVNDYFGHAAGDAVLQGLAGLLKNLARQTDSVARFGGEEFLIILPDTTRDDAILLAEKICHVVGQAGLLEQRTITLSIGIAVATEQHGSEDQIVNHADQGLYQAKERGRNRVVVFDIW